MGYKIPVCATHTLRSGSAKESTHFAPVVNLLYWNLKLK